MPHPTGKLIEQQTDVRRLIALRPVPGGYVYLIETPFMTFPRFVVGECAPDLSWIQIRLKCGQLHNARKFYDQLDPTAAETADPGRTMEADA